MHGKTHRVELWFKRACAIPILATLLVLVEAAIAQVVLGRVPIPSIDDPKNLPTDFIHSISTLFVLSTDVILIFLIAVIVKNRRVIRSESAYWVWLGLLAGGWLSGMLVPDHILRWWWD